MGSGTHVGALLRAARKGRVRGPVGWREIDKELDLRKSSVEHWEAGRVKHLPIAQVMALADYLEIPLDDLQAAALADAKELRSGQGGVPASPAGDAPGQTGPDGGKSPLSEAAERRQRGSNGRSRQRS